MYEQSVQNSIPVTPGSQGQPKPQVGAVNITINGVNTPQPGMQGAYQYPQYPQGPVYYPQYLPVYYPQQTQAQPQQPQTQPIPSQGIKPDETVEKQPEEKPIAANKISDDKKEPENITPINKETIVSIEKQLENEESTERGKAVTQLIKLFKEDESRKNDPALNNLLNKALQDEKSANVRFMALDALVNGYAVGTPETLTILQKMADENKNPELGDLGNSALAQKALSVLSDSISNFSYNPKSVSIKENDIDVGQKLDLMAE